MIAMILAAGKGERMKPLTDDTPKSLLEVGGKPLLQYHVEALAAANVTEIVINTGIHGNKIESRFGSGHGYGVNIRYSREGDNPLETAGGIRQALSMLGPFPFILVNADIWTRYDFSSLPTSLSGLAHLVLVDNPDHHPGGDFALSGSRVLDTGPDKLTYSGIGVYHPKLFEVLKPGYSPLAPLLRAAINDNRVSGEYYPGDWQDIGTPARLDGLNKKLSEYIHT